MLNEDQVNTIINDQEEVIAGLRQKLLEMEDLKDIAVGKGLELVTALKRIECLDLRSTPAHDMKEVARQAIDAYQAK